MAENKGAQELQNLLDTWPENQAEVKAAYISLKEHAESIEGVVWEFIARTGVTNSLRLDVAPRPDGRERPLFCMADAVPMGDEMVLSVCFYADEVDDPDEAGDIIPGGLLGADGYCFDADADDLSVIGYIKDRISTAAANAAKG